MPLTVEETECSAILENSFWRSISYIFLIFPGLLNG